MTNAQIITMNTEALIEAGVITEEETIHTYQAWQSLGMQVKKGSKAVAKFQVWKKSKKRTVEVEDEDGEKKEIKKGGNFFMQTAAFFSSSQVEAIGA